MKNKIHLGGDILNAMDVPLQSKVSVLEHIVRGHELRDTLELICYQTESMDPLMRCCVMIVDPIADCLRMGAAPSLPAIFHAEMDALEIKDGSASCGTAAVSKRPVFVNDIAQDPLWQNYKDLAAQVGFHACWSHPIINEKSEVLGTFAMCWDEVRGPISDEVMFLESQSDLCGLAIDHARTTGSLRESEMTSRALLEGSPVCNKIIDMDSRLVYMSAAGIEMLKIPDIEARYGRTYPPDFYGEEMRAPLVEHLERAQAGEKTDVECPLTSTDGRLVWMQTTFVPVTGNDGKVAYVIASSVDITTRKQAEEEAMRALSEAERANQSKSAFLANMSHDLRTPLNAIIGFTQMMETQVFGPLGNARYEQYTKDILNSGNLLVSLINDILDISKIEAGKYELTEEPINIGDAIDDSIKMLSTIARTGRLSVMADIQTDLPSLLADQRSIVQILNNLLSNAIKFTPPKGDVKVVAKCIDDALEISVIDSGIGMTRKDIERVLQPFEQVGSNTTRPNDGTGLGLHLCQQLAELHAGSLVVESEINKGTCVKVSFPIARTVHQ